MVCMYHSFLIYSSADGHLGCFHVLAVINSAAMNIGMHVSLSDLVSLVCMLRSGIAGSHKGNYKQGEKTALRLGENNSKRSNRQRINLKNIQATPPTQLQKNK